jgi:hypothetical protein
MKTFARWDGTIPLQVAETEKRPDWELPKHMHPTEAVCILTSARLHPQLSGRAVRTADSESVGGFSL